MNDSTISTAPSPVVIFDLDTLRFRWFRTGHLQVLTADAEPLGAASGAGGEEREVVFQALEDAARNGQVRRNGTWHAVGFYNPITSQVSVGALPNTVVFTIGAWDLGRSGKTGEFGPDVLVLDGTPFAAEHDIPFPTVVSRLAAHLSPLQHDHGTHFDLPADVIGNEVQV